MGGAPHCVARLYLDKNVMNTLHRSTFQSLCISCAEGLTSFDYVVQHLLFRYPGGSPAKDYHSYELLNGLLHAYHRRRDEALTPTPWHEVAIDAIAEAVRQIAERVCSYRDATPEQRQCSESERIESLSRLISDRLTQIIPAPELPVPKGCILLQFVSNQGMKCWANRARTAAECGKKIQMPSRHSLAQYTFDETPLLNALFCFRQRGHKGVPAEAYFPRLVQVRYALGSLWLLVELSRYDNGRMRDPIFDACTSADIDYDYVTYATDAPVAIGTQMPLLSSSVMPAGFVLYDRSLGWLYAFRPEDADRIPEIKKLHTKSFTL